MSASPPVVSQDIKRCPFCGGVFKTQFQGGTLYVTHDDCRVLWYLEVTSADVRQWFGPHDGTNESLYQQLAAQWLNRRAP